MSFASQLKQFADKVKTTESELLQAIVLEMGNSVIELSPVGNPDLWLHNRGTKENPDYVDYIAYRGEPDGYVGGRFRANWQHASGVIPLASVPGVDPSGDDTRRRLVASIQDIEAGGIEYFVNNLPYAIALEYGHSSQAPVGMVRTTQARFQGIVNAKVKALV